MTGPDQTAGLRLTVTTPTRVVVEAEGVRHVRAEDESGLFGVLPGHADFLTSLSISVLSWRNADGREEHVALRGGMLTVDGGRHIRVAAREAIPGDDLELLEKNLLAAFAEDEARERMERDLATKLEMAALRQVEKYLRPDSVRVRSQGPGNGNARR